MKADDETVLSFFAEDRFMFFSFLLPSKTKPLIVTSFEFGAITTVLSFGSFANAYALIVLTFFPIVTFLIFLFP